MLSSCVSMWMSWKREEGSGEMRASESLVPDGILAVINGSRVDGTSMESFCVRWWLMKAKV